MLSGDFLQLQDLFVLSLIAYVPFGFSFVEQEVDEEQKKPGQATSSSAVGEGLFFEGMQCNRVAVTIVGRPWTFRISFCVT